MAKFSGYIGFATSGLSPTQPGVWKDTIEERKYCGDVVKDIHRNEGDDRVVPNFNVSNSFSILADTYARQNLERMVYLKYMGIAWKITSFEVQYPRLIISVGGIYNGPQS